MFYSISNTQKGLGGVSFGNFLIKQVVEDLKRELPESEDVRDAVARPGLRRWLERERRWRRRLVSVAAAKEALVVLDEPGWNDDPATVEKVRRCPALGGRLLLPQGQDPKGRPVDPVARFHLGNGARLERLNFLGDVSAERPEAGARA